MFVNINWDKVCPGKHEVPLTIISSNGEEVIINLIVNNFSVDENKKKCFVESNGYVSIEAPNFSKTIETENIQWKIIPNLGRTFSAVTPFPATSKEIIPGNNSPRLEYEVYLTSTGEVSVDAYFSPTLNFNYNKNGIRYAVSFDDELPQMVNMTSNTNPPDLNRDPLSNKWVADNINVQTSKLKIDKPGLHTLKIWMVDPGIVLQKIVIETGSIKPSYLGPPESAIIK